MKIEIQYPYSEDYTNAYLVSSQGRNTVCLYDSVRKVRSSTSYARYLMTVSLKRYLTDDEQVDHKDNDKSNDALYNLQLLTMKENLHKQYSLKGRKKVEYICPVCHNSFIRRRGLSHFTQKDKKSITCSRKCGGTISSLPIENRILFVREFIDHS